VARLIEAGFARSIAPDYDAAGRVAFRMYAHARAIHARLVEGALGLVAEAAGAIVGYAELQGAGRVLAGRDHLSLLFVAPEWQRQGVARRLLAGAVARLRLLRDPPPALTVNAAPGALPAYRRLGFVATGPEAVIDGVRAVPMRLPLGGSAEPAPAQRDDEQDHERERRTDQAVTALGQGAPVDTADQGEVEPPAAQRQAQPHIERMAAPLQVPGGGA
jgi:GNAT superfamily N-acetyltransferase